MRIILISQTDKELLLRVLRYFKRISKDRYFSIVVEARELSKEELIKLMEKAGIKPVIAMDTKSFAS